MAPLIVLVMATLLARLAGQLGVRSLRHWAAATRAALALMFCFTAIAHFNAMRPDLVRMVPPWVPAPELMVTFTGVCEILGAVGLLITRTQRIAAQALILFLVAVLPANIRSQHGRHDRRRAGDASDPKNRVAGFVHRAGLVVRHPREAVTQQCRRGL